jgi:hypothetical protein
MTVPWHRKAGRCGGVGKVTVGLSLLARLCLTGNGAVVERSAGPLKRWKVALFGWIEGYPRCLDRGNETSKWGGKSDVTEV